MKRLIGTICWIPQTPQLRRFYDPNSLPATNEIEQIVRDEVCAPVLMITAFLLRQEIWFEMINRNKQAEMKS